MRKLLAELRQEADLTQRELAKALKITPGAVGMYETGRRTPRLPLLRTMAELLSDRLGRIIHIEDISFGTRAHEAKAGGRQVREQHA